MKKLIQTFLLRQIYWVLIKGHYPLLQTEPLPYPQYCRSDTTFSYLQTSFFCQFKKKGIKKKKKKEKIKKLILNHNVTSAKCESLGIWSVYHFWTFLRFLRIVKRWFVSSVSFWCLITPFWELNACDPWVSTLQLKRETQTPQCLSITLHRVPFCEQSDL